jgi:cysteine desulfurase/selenocysteine lyase
MESRAMSSVPRIPARNPGGLIKDIASLRADFPILDQEIAGKPLVYLDSAASAQRPRAVIDAMVEQEQRNHANVHRGVHELSQRSTAAYEGAREKVRRFINAAASHEIIFTRGTTESINLVASSLGGQLLEAGDEVLLTTMEHHSNIVPWQLICEKTGARVVPAPITPRGELDLPAFESRLSRRTKIVAFGHVSNALGTINPVEELTAKAHAAGAVVLIDGAQAAPHLQIDVRAVDCDFYAFSSHKMFGPTGIGVLYGKTQLLETMPPYQGGGEMIRTVSFEATTYNALPYKFEAGTPHITGAIGLGATIDYLAGIDFESRSRYEDELLEYATQELIKLPEIRIIGEAREKAGIVSFLLGGIHAHDLGTILDREGVAVRTGHHCAMPVMDHFKIPATARASFAFYNNRDDVDRLVEGLKRALEFFA